MPKLQWPAGMLREAADDGAQRLHTVFIVYSDEDYNAGSMLYSHCDCANCSRLLKTYLLKLVDEIDRRSGPALH